MTDAPKPTARQVLRICANLEREARAVLWEAGLDHVELRLLRPHCSSTCEHVSTCACAGTTARPGDASREPLEKSVPGGAVVASIGCERHPTLEADAASGAYAVSAKTCGHLLAPGPLLEQARARGCCVLLPSQLELWRPGDEPRDPAALRAALGTARSLLVLDSGIHPRLAEQLEATSRWLGLPGELLPVGLDLLRERVLRALHAARTLDECARLREAADTAEKRASDFSAGFVLIEQLVGVRDEDELIEGMLQVFELVFTPRRLSYVPLVDGRRGKRRTRAAWPASSAAASSPRRASAGSAEGGSGGAEAHEHGLVVPVESQGEQFGILELEGLAFPTLLSLYAELAETFARILGLAIGNARAIARITRNEQQQRLLAGVSRVLATTLDSAPAFDELAQLVVKKYASACVIQAVDPVDRRLRCLGACAPPAAPETMPALDALVTQVLETAAPAQWIEAPPAVVEELFGRDGAPKPLAMRIAPLVARDKALGALTFLLPKELLDDEGQEIAAEVVRRCGLALENVYLYQEASFALRTRDMLFASISHDLRNPIASVILRLENLRAQPDALQRPEQAREGMQWLHAKLWKLIDRVDELQDIAGVSAEGTLDLVREPIDLVELVQGILEDPSLEGRSRVVFRPQNRQLIGDWDGDQLERVVENLLSNAIKYSPDGGEVSISLTRQAAKAQLVFEDHGVGIPADELGRVFDGLFRAQNVLRRFPGTGLGLFGARRIVQAHGGSIEVESEEGRGSKVTVTLPLESPAEAVATGPGVAVGWGGLPRPVPPSLQRSPPPAKTTPKPRKRR